MDGAISVHGLERAGFYGGYHPLKRVLDARKANFACQTIAWSGGQWDHRVNIRQGPTVHVGGASCDADESRTPDYGQWPRPATRVSKPSAPAGRGQAVARRVHHRRHVHLTGLATQLGWPVPTLIRMTAVHYGAFGPGLAGYLDGLADGTVRPRRTCPPAPRGCN